MLSSRDTNKVNIVTLLVTYVLLLCILQTARAKAASRFPGGSHISLPSSASANLIQNPGFSVPIQSEGPSTDGITQAPAGWFIAAGGMVHDSRFWLSARNTGTNTAIGITGGQDRQGKWNTVLPACKPGDRYLFKAGFYRHDLADPEAYPEISIWGKTFRLNTLRMVQRFQPLHVEMTCPQTIPAKNRIFSFINMYSNVTFWMRNPSLMKRKKHPNDRQVPPKIDYFPIGVYGATGENLKQIKESGLNSVIIGLNKQSIEACHEQNIHCTFSVPRDPEKLIEELDRLETLLKRGNFSFYVNDEPGIHSFPSEKAAALQRILKSRFPTSFTAMAIVRPQVIPDYQEGADYFMLDQYPIPHMPMIWLSESMDEGAGFVGRNRLQSVIQAFGGQGSAKAGWPRLPTFAEMNCLTFLSIIHGSRGVYFFSFPDISASQAGKEDLERVVNRLNGLHSWLYLINEERRPKVTMVSRYGSDPAGHPAVHCAWKRRNGTRLLLCVNTIRTSVVAEITCPAEDIRWRDYYSYKRYYTVDKKVHIRFLPLEVQILIEDR
jgi:hypothetical protein